MVCGVGGTAPAVFQECSRYGAAGWWQHTPAPCVRVGVGRHPSVVAPGVARTIPGGPGAVGYGLLGAVLWPRVCARLVPVVRVGRGHCVRAFAHLCTWWWFTPRRGARRVGPGRRCTTLAVQPLAGAGCGGSKQAGKQASKQTDSKPR